jgi:hypothetical protein
MNANTSHAEYAKLNPPREGYTCGPHAETFGGGCFNCGWLGPKLAPEGGFLRCDEPPIYLSSLSTAQRENGGKP